MSFESKDSSADRTKACPTVIICDHDLQKALVSFDDSEAFLSSSAACSMENLSNVDNRKEPSRMKK